MRSPQPSRNNRAIDPVLRRMGMSLSVLGAFAVSAGLAALRWGSGNNRSTSAVLLMASGIIALITGICIWHGARKAR